MTTRIVGAVLIAGALLAIGLYARFSPYQRCIRERMQDPVFVAEHVSSPWGTRYHAETICRFLTD